MIVRRAATAAVLTAAALVLASCSSNTEPGKASPAPVSSAADQYDVPAVSNPLDVTQFLKDPCALVPGDEPAQIGFTKPPEAALPENNSSARLAGPGCDWKATDGGVLGVNIQTENTKNGMGGMQGVYDAHFVTGQYSYLEPTEVDGYPAAFADGADLRDQGKTALRVGIADDLTFAVSIGPLDSRKLAEEGARTIADAVIRTLKSGR